MSLAERIISGERRALAKGITLIESARPDDRAEALALLDQLNPKTGNSIRIGLSGTPGVGKSTFIETLGVRLIDAGHKVCVLSIDPSSRLTGGSILGDKTRMQQLANHPNAYIRPSPAGQTLGGVARRSREVLLVCEAAGFDLILIETVGVGQSETAVADMADIFFLLLQPAAGDELQGIKRGIMELADIIAVNKADGALVAAANETARTTLQAIRYQKPHHPEWNIPVIPCSSTEQTGFEIIERAIFKFIDQQKTTGQFQRRRNTQILRSFEDELLSQMLDYLYTHKHYAETHQALQDRLLARTLSPASAAETLIHSIIKS